MTDQIQKLLRKLKGKNVKGYYLGLQEDENNIVASLSNGILNKPAHLDKLNDNLVLGYVQVTNKKKRTIRTFQCEVIKDDTTVAITIRDLGTGRLLSKNLFPSPTRHDHRTQFKTIEECIRDFQCMQGGQLQCEANRTCKNQYVSMICCLKNGFCFSVHLVFRPTSARCQILSIVPHLEGLVVSK